MFSTDVSVGPLKDELERGHMARWGPNRSCSLYWSQCESHLGLFSAAGEKCHIPPFSIYCSLSSGLYKCLMCICLPCGGYELFEAESTCCLYPHTDPWVFVYWNCIQILYTIPARVLALTFKMSSVLQKRIHSSKQFSLWKQWSNVCLSSEGCCF